MNPILVVGSAHIDAVAITSEVLSDDRPDVEGRVTFSLGGTAFNVAKNLAQHGQTVELLTSLKEGSITSNLVQEQCRSFGIGLRWPVNQNESEGGFAGHFAGAKVFKAVCEAAIERVTAKRFEDAFRRALRHASIVIADTNLSVDQLREVLQLSNESSKKLIIAGVSVSRVQRLRSAVEQMGPGDSYLIDTLCVNADEARALDIVAMDRQTLIEDPLKAVSVSAKKKLRARRIALSCGERGYYLIDSNESETLAMRHGVVNISPSEVKSDNGAGDAMVAAIAAVHGDDFKAWIDSIQQYVAPVLKVASATTEDDLTIARAKAPGGARGAWMWLAVSVIAMIGSAVAGRIDSIGSHVKGTDVAFLLAAILGLSAGAAGGRIRDIAASMGLIDVSHRVSGNSAVLPAVAGLLVLVSFLVLPGFSNGRVSDVFSAPKHEAAALWFLVSFVGGYFTDLVARQRLELKELKDLVGSKE